MLPAEFDLTGRTAIVTGGGTGIGRATALLLARRGADVAVAGRRPEPLDNTADEIRAIGRRALAVPADVCQPASAKAMVEKVAAEFGRIDILINNAGGVEHYATLATMDLAKWNGDVALNLNSAMYCAQAAYPYLKEARGNVVNVSSYAGVHGVAGVGAYSAGKAGLQMFTRVASAEWGPHGIRVNCVACGMIISEQMIERWEKDGYDPSESVKNFPLRRYGQMDEIAQTIAFFVSDAASYITGENLYVGGGPQIGSTVPLE